MTITDDDSAGVSVEPTALTVTEGDASGGSYTVVLASQPTAGVTVTVSGHAGSDVTVSPATLTFTAANWATPQTVTVTAGEDHDAVADPSVTLSHAVSGTGEYASVTADSVTVTITDDDSAGVSVEPTALTVTEGASDGSYTVVLDTRPSGDVTVTVGGHDGTDLSLDKTTLTFTPANWDQPQTVTVSAAPDDDAAADEVTLTHAVSGTGEYASVAAADVVVTITDDDSAGVSVTPTELTVTEGDAGGGSYTVVLASQPTADVTVTVGGDDGSDVTVSPGALTFTAANWATPQTVTVSAAPDDDAAADEVTLTHAVSGTGEYASVAAADVVVTITDDDSAGVSVEPTALTVTEGDAGGGLLHGRAGHAAVGGCDRDRRRP